MSDSERPELVPRLDSLHDALESFVERYRRGEQPDVAEYLEQFPGQEEEVRELLSAAARFEQVGAEQQEATDGIPGQVNDNCHRFERLGDYRILREVGRGGMGVVYEAEQESLGRHVAIKVLPRHLLMDERALARFRREAHALASLHHSNIVPVFGLGEEQGVHYYAMQFIEGQPLDAVLQDVKSLRATVLQTGEIGSAHPAESSDASRIRVRGLLRDDDVGEADAECPSLDSSAEAGVPGSALPGGSNSLLLASGDASGFGSHDPRLRYYRSIAQIGLQVADALSYAHGQGVLHRDVKPSNLLLDAKGTIWLTDFGLAREADSDDLTHTGDVVGTLTYMAPERFRGWSDPRSDIYGLGVTLYELLTLRRVFSTGDRALLVRMVTRWEPVRPRKIDSRIPRDLETVVLKMIEKEPSRRYQTAAEIVEDLCLFLADRPIRARRSSPTERFLRCCRRNPMTTVLAGATVLFLLVAGVALAFSLALRAERDIALELRKTAESAAADASYWRAMEKTRALRLSDKPGHVFGALDAIRAASDILGQLELPEGERRDRVLALRNEVIACETLVDVQVAPQPFLHEPRNVLFDPEFKRYAQYDPDGDVTIHSIDDGRQLADLPGFGELVVTMRFGARGDLLAVKYLPDLAGKVRVFDTRSGDCVLDVPAEVSSWAVDFSPDAEKLVVGRADGSIGVYEIGSQGPGKVLPASERTLVCYLRVHPAGRCLAATCSPPSGGPSTRVQVLDLETGDVLRQLDHGSLVRCVAWHPHGKLLAAACGDFHVRVWDTSSRKEPLVLEGHEAEVVSVVFSHGGDLLASIAWDETTRIWEPFGGILRLTTGQGARRDFLRFGPEDRLLAYTEHDGGTHLWRLLPGPGCRTLHGHESWAKGPSHGDVSPDGRVLASWSGDGVRLWELRTGRELAHLPIQSQGSRESRGAVMFHPSGSALFTSSRDGLHRWPLVLTRGEKGAPDCLRVGPPRLLGRGNHERACLSVSGQTLVVARGRRGHVYDLRTGASRKLSEDHDGLECVAVSADDRWVATGTWYGKNVNIWEARTGRLLKELPMESALAAFSPDGRWLVTSTGEEYQFWDVASWTPRHSIRREGFRSLDGPLAFTADSALAAVVTSHGVVTLVRPLTGEEVASFETLEPAWLCFSPDGRTLAVATVRQAIQVWDLCRIRGRLRELELDWGPPHAPLAPDAARATRLTVELLHGE